MATPELNLTLNLNLDHSNATFSLIEALAIMADSPTPIQPNEIGDALEQWRVAFDENMELGDGP